MSWRGGDVSAIRVGVIGLGMIGAVHVRAARSNGARLMGIVASTPERSREAAQRLGAEKVFDTSDALIDNANVDLVHICTPNYLHAPLALRAIQAGKHVICEKPLALDANEAETLSIMAQQSGVVTAVPFVYRYNSLIRESRARFASGAAGRVHLIHGHYLQDWLLNQGDHNWRVDADKGGVSRTFADIGSHWCDLAEFVTGHTIESVSAQRYVAHAERLAGLERQSFSGLAVVGQLAPVRTEDAMAVQFRTTEGALGSMLASQVSAGRKNRLAIEINGAIESVAFDQEHPEELWRGRRDGADHVMRDPVNLVEDARRMTWLPAGHPEGYERCFEVFVGDAYDAVRTGLLPVGFPTFDDGLRSARIVDAVLTSARTQTWVDVSG